MGRVEATLDALIDEAWRQHQRDPLQLLPAGQRIVAAAEAAHDPAGAAWGWLHQAWGQRFRGDRDAAQAALSRAEAAFVLLQHARGLASCRDLQAMVLGMEGRFDESAALLAMNDTRPEGGRSAWERVCTHQRQSWLHGQLGQRDASLKERYSQWAAAQETGDAATVAHAMAALGGEHADLFNLEEAERLCRAAMALADEGGAPHAWCMAALNGMNSLVAQNRGAEAVPWVERLLALEPAQNWRAREHRLIVYADALAQGGEVDRAQALLDESRAARGEGGGHTLSWITAQCVVWATQGQWQPLREMAQAWLHEPQYGSGPGRVPTEELRLVRLAGRACEALGDLPAALAWERRAFELHENLVGRSARASRLALEVEHQLASERRQRSQAEAEQQRLDAMNQALQAASAAKTRFLAAASHDLRQPVQALALNMAALEQEDVTPVQAQLVQRMGRSLQALGQMFDVLLDISRLDAGIVPVAAQPLDLRPLLLRLRDDVAATAGARGLQVRLHLPWTRPQAAMGAPHRTQAAPSSAGALMTHTDPVLLERCLRNLLDNAAKYTPRGGLLLALRPGDEEPGGPTWWLQVWDTGIGMAPDVQARVFDEFYQADNPERDRARGLGLGLSIVQRLARLLGHGLVLHSRAGRGTRVQLVLPRVVAPQSAAAPPASGNAPQAQPLCVAVLDDDADVRDGLIAVLQRWGHTVLAGADPVAVLQRWRARGRPVVQAIVSDLRLRGTLTGVDAVAALRQAWSAQPSDDWPQPVPALVITGDVSPERLQLLRDSGLPWLPKPVMPMRLRSWLAAGRARTGPHSLD